MLVPNGVHYRGIPLYILTVSSVLTTNLSQISLCQLLFRATLKFRLARLMFVTTLGTDNFDCTKMNAHLKKFTACLLVSPARLSHREKRVSDSGQIPIIISCLTRQEILGVLVDLVANGARGCLFWHATWRTRRFKGSPAFSEHVPIMFIPTSLGMLLLSMQHQSLMRILTRLSSPCESLTGETIVYGMSSFTSGSKHY